ncbi:MAG: SDR family oxidoreductase [Calditrichaeota bacterium]|nr:SDR family oxidoreductase [Calditrichota bacterium]
MKTKNILITGISGYISQYLLLTKPQNVNVIGTARRRILNRPDYFPQTIIRLDLQKDVFSQLEQLTLPVDAVIHTAAMSGLGACEKDPQLAKRINAEATGELARWCQNRRIRLIYFSTDIVFKGDAPPYDENSRPDPINVYGQTKWEGELKVRENYEDYAIGRIALAMAPGLNNTSNFIDWFVNRLHNGRQIPLFKDEIRTPTFTPLLAEKFWEITLSADTGIFHVCGAQAIDRYSLGKAICQYLGKGFELLKPISLKDMRDYPRPVDVSLISKRTMAKKGVEIGSILSYLDKMFDKKGTSG